MDRLTQLQVAADQLLNQMIASLWYVNRHHDFQTLGPNDVIRPMKEDESENRPVLPHPPEIFKAGQKELARDLIIKEQQMEYLISELPGLKNSKKDQEETIKQLEEELKVAEEERRQAVKEKEEVLARLEAVIRNVKRP